jgi:prepilin-type N-terminal cleavage/methylation domain-containing protein
MPKSDISAGLRRGHFGFSLIELLVVIVIAGVLIGISVPAVGRAQAQRRVMNARDSFVWLASRARMAAVERGRVARLELDPATGQATVILQLATDSTLEVVRYWEEYGVAVGTESGTAIRVCYDSRGYAMESACTMAGLPDMVLFTDGGQFAARARVLPLGQVERR